MRSGQRSFSTSSGKPKDKGIKQEKKNIAINLKTKHLRRIEINFSEEDATYQGKPLIMPKNPYKPKLKKIRKPDPSWSFPVRFARKTQYVVEDFASFVSDIARFRTNDVIFRTAAFTKRNFLWVVSKMATLEYKWQHVKHEVRMAIKGFRLFGKDVAWVIKKRTSQGKYE
jgi:hypothetical protein